MWITLDADIIAERLSGPELSAMQSAALASGQDGASLTDNAAERVTNSIRGYIAASAKNTLGPAGTIPDELLDCALALVVHQIITRLPGMEALLDERRMKNREEALQLLRDVAAGKFALVQPEAAGQQAGGGGIIQTLNKPKRTFTRDSMKGVL